MDKLSYPELLIFTSSCKYFISIQPNYFLKRKDKFHNPNKKFQIVHDPSKIYDCCNICINHNEIATVWNYDNYTAHRYRACLWPNFFTSLHYSNLTFPFEFSDTTWNKIKYRFKQLELGKLINYHWPFVVTIIKRGQDDNYDYPENQDDKDYLINQVKLLYYAFKYFRNEIMIF